VKKREVYNLNLIRNPELKRERFFPDVQLQDVQLQDGDELSVPLATATQE